MTITDRKRTPIKSQMVFNQVHHRKMLIDGDLMLIPMYISRQYAVPGKGSSWVVRIVRKNEPLIRMFFRDKDYDDDKSKSLTAAYEFLDNLIETKQIKTYEKQPRYFVDETDAKQLYTGLPGVQIIFKDRDGLPAIQIYGTCGIVKEAGILSRSISLKNFTPEALNTNFRLAVGFRLLKQHERELGLPPDLYPDETKIMLHDNPSYKTPSYIEVLTHIVEQHFTKNAPDLSIINTQETVTENVLTINVCRTNAAPNNKTESYSFTHTKYESKEAARLIAHCYAVCIAKRKQVADPNVASNKMNRQIKLVSTGVKDLFLRTKKKNRYNFEYSFNNEQQIFPVDAYQDAETAFRETFLSYCYDFNISYDKEMVKESLNKVKSTLSEYTELWAN